MYKIFLSNSKIPIPVENIEEVELILQRIKEGNKFIVCKHGIFNPSFLVEIVFDEGMDSDSAYRKRLGYKDEKLTSHFAKLLGPKMKMIKEGK